MKKVIFRCILIFGLSLLVLEILAYAALTIRPTGNPLARPSDEAALNYYLKSDGWHYFSIRRNHEQVLRSDEFDTIVRTNNKGLREEFDHDGEPVDVGFVGDSFTLGYGVNDGERYSDYLRQLLGGRAVLNYGGANGDSTPHYYLFLKNNPDLVPKLLIIGLFPWNDFREDVSELKFFYDEANDLVRTRRKNQKVLKDGFLTHINFSGDREPSWRRWMREFNLGRILLLTHHRVQRILGELTEMQREGQPKSNFKSRPRASEAEVISMVDAGRFDDRAKLALDYIIRIKSLMQRKGGKLLVLYIPTSYAVGNYPYFCEYISGYSREICIKQRNRDYLGQALSDWFSQQKIEFISPVSIFRQLEKEGTRLYYEKDGHWNPKGHWEAAKLLHLYIQRQRL